MYGKGLLAKAIVELFTLVILLPFYMVAVLLHWLFVIVKLPFSTGGHRKRRKIGSNTRTQAESEVLYEAEIEVQLPVDQAELEKQLEQSGVIEKAVDEVMGRVDLLGSATKRKKRE